MDELMTHTNHVNDMSTWSEIRCQRGHESHETRRVHVDLAQPHGYHDYAQVPKRLARSFDMMIYPPETYPVDGGPYCPAHDAVSETIVSHGIWEPRETALTLAVCESAAPGSMIVDYGAQLGWFSLLAASCGLKALAIEADHVNIDTIRASRDANGWSPQLIEVVGQRVGPHSSPWQVFSRPVRLAKIDVEGAEDSALAALWPSIAAGLVDFMLIEVSPVFADYYPDMVASIIDAGYRAYLLPPKQQPPVTLDNPEWDLAPYRFDTLNPDTVLALVGAWHQENVLFMREGASW